MKNQIFCGSGVAIATPFNPDFSINFEEFARLIDFQIENKTDAIIVCGTTGEASTMDDKEHLSCIEFCKKHVAGRVPVVAGVGSNDTRHAIELTKEAVCLGVDGLLHVTPYYNKTNQSGLVKHFSIMAEVANGVPIILYNVPSRTGMTIKPETYVELCKIDNIVATKEASGDISSIAKTASLCGDNLAIYSGNDDQILPLMSLGGIGVISVIANVAPKITHDICAEYLAGNTKEAAKLQLEVISLCDAMFCDVNPIPVKAALNLLGYKAGECRLPLGSLDDVKLNFVKEELKKWSND